jgi:hypothetical protein
MKLYVTFDEEQVITIRGVVYDKDCIAELTLDVERDFRKLDIENEVHYVFSNSYKEIHLHTPPTDKYYPRGIIAAN